MVAVIALSAQVLLVAAAQEQVLALGLQELQILVVEQVAPAHLVLSVLQAVQVSSSSTGLCRITLFSIPLEHGLALPV